MISLNRVTLIGNVGREPEFKMTNEGKEVIHFSLATSEQWTDRKTGEKREKTEWHRVVIFNENLGSVVKNHVRKGSRLYLEGSVQTRKWNDQSGQEKFTTEVVLQNFGSSLILLDSRNSNNTNATNDPSRVGQNNASSNHNDSSYRATQSSSNSSSNFNYSELDDEVPF